MLVHVCRACGARNRLEPARLGDEARCGKCHGALGPLDQPLAIASAADFDALVGSSPLPVVVDFWAGWCGPCAMVAPEVERLAREQRGRIVVAKVDTEALPEVASRYGIRGIPAFLRFEAGRVVQHASGAMPAEGILAGLGLG